jgi:DNA-binding MarR family transcriptional regulator
VFDSDLGYLLQRSARLYRGRLAVALLPLGLTPQQAAALIAMHSAPGRSLTHRGVAEAIDADVATTTGLLGRLERDGWIVSAANPADGRSKLFSMTKAAERVLPQLLLAAQDVSASAHESLTAEECMTLEALLGKLVGVRTESVREGSR